MKMNFTVEDFIISGGIKHMKPYSEFAMKDFLKLAVDDDIWVTNDVTMITIPLNEDVHFIIVYNIENNQYMYDELEISPGTLGYGMKKMNKRDLFFSEQFRQSDCLKEISIVDEVFDEEEKVFFLSNGVNMHFIKSHKVDDYVIAKITICEEWYREDIKRILTGTS